MDVDANGDHHRKVRQRRQKREWARERRRREREFLEQLKQENKELEEYNVQLHADVATLRDLERRKLLQLRNIRISNRRKSAGSTGLLLVESLSRPLLTSTVAVRQVLTSAANVCSVPYTECFVRQRSVCVNAGPSVSTDNGCEAAAEDMFNRLFCDGSQPGEDCDDCSFSSSQSSTSSEDIVPPSLSTTTRLAVPQMSVESNFTDAAMTFSQSSVVAEQDNCFLLSQSSARSDGYLPHSQTSINAEDSNCFPLSQSSATSESSYLPSSQSSVDTDDNAYLSQSLPEGNRTNSLRVGKISGRLSTPVEVGKISGRLSTPVEVGKISGRLSTPVEVGRVFSASKPFSSTEALDINALVHAYGISTGDGICTDDISIPTSSAEGGPRTRLALRPDCKRTSASVKPETFTPSSKTSSPAGTLGDISSMLQAYDVCGGDDISFPTSSAQPLA